MKKKNIPAAVISMLLAISLAACGKSNENDSYLTAKTEMAEDTSAEATVSETSEDETEAIETDVPETDAIDPAVLEAFCKEHGIPAENITAELTGSGGWPIHVDAHVDASAFENLRYYQLGEKKWDTAEISRIANRIFPENSVFTIPQDDYIAASEARKKIQTLSYPSITETDPQKKAELERQLADARAEYKQIIETAEQTPIILDEQTMKTGVRAYTIRNDQVLTVSVYDSTIDIDNEAVRSLWYGDSGKDMTISEEAAAALCDAFMNTTGLPLERKKCFLQESPRGTKCKYRFVYCEPDISADEANFGSGISALIVANDDGIISAILLGGQTIENEQPVTYLPFAQIQEVLLRNLPDFNIYSEGMYDVTVTSIELRTGPSETGIAPVWEAKGQIRGIVDGSPTVSTDAILGHINAITGESDPWGRS